MNKKLCAFKKILVAGICVVAIIPFASLAAPSTNSGYAQLNIVSDVVSQATHLDPRVLNAWGIVATPLAIWVNDNHSGLDTHYSALGKPSKSAVNIPAPGGGVGAPTGLAANETRSFVITNNAGTKHAPADFIACTEDGTIVAWNSLITGTNAIIVADLSASDANYKGLAIARDTNNAPHIYAANFRSQVVDVFDGQFNLVGHFTDPELPDDFAPFNIRTLRGRLFVTFARKATPTSDDDQPGPGNGYVDIFDTDGTLLRRFAEQGALNSPWGMAIAPKNFGKFSRALLVGNFGNGRINAFDLLTGKLLGHFTTDTGSDLVMTGFGD